MMRSLWFQTSRARNPHRGAIDRSLDVRMFLGSDEGACVAMPEVHRYLRWVRVAGLSRRLFVCQNLTVSARSHRFCHFFAEVPTSLSNLGKEPLSYFSR